jgi:hypothetical protein
VQRGWSEPEQRPVLPACGDPRGRSERIADKLKRDRLPKREPAKLWAGFGNGRPCDGCDDPILAADVEHELDFPHGTTLGFHATCSLVWQRMTGR